MKLLIFTQKVDKNDPVLGFFHNWILSFSKRAKEIIVICLYKGEYDFPKNVTVYSLGKEKGYNRLRYIITLYKYLLLIKNSYDVVFVHMNQEYVLAAGLYWKMKNIPTYMWRNHGSGSFLTKIAVALCTKVFCTSDKSFTAKFKKCVLMPVGVDTTIFKPNPSIVRKKHSVCMVGRVAKLKHNDKAIIAINSLIKSGSQVSLSIIGPVSEKELSYFARLKEYINKHDLTPYVSLMKEVVHDKLPDIYCSYEICINLSEAGMFDKTIIESAACGAIPLVSNLSDNVPKEILIPGNSIEAIADTIRKMLESHKRIEVLDKLKDFVLTNNLESLTDKLFEEIEIK